MGRTRIDLVSSGTIDLYDDVSMSLNYSIADIKEPNKRNASYSKTITIPGTKNNNNLFSQIFEVGITGGFNPNLKAKAIIYVDTIPVFSGNLQLTNVIINEDRIEYECVVFGKMANIYNIWADDEIKDISFADLNHTYSAQNIINSWYAATGDGYVYPLIDYGRTDGSYYQVKHFQPAVYLKEYIDKIFFYAGYTYTSSFFDSAFFKRLIIPFNGVKLYITQQEIADRTFKATNTAEYNLTINTGIVQPVAYNIAFDSLITTPNPAGQYNTGTYTWTVNKTGSYIVHWNLVIDFIVNNTTGGNITTLGQSNFICSVGIIKNGAMAYSSSTNYIRNGATYTASSSTTVLNDSTFKGNATLDLIAGDTIKIAFGAQVGFMANGLTFTTKLNAGGTFFNVPLPETAEGDTIDFSTALPDKLKIRDLFTSVLKAFNLYVDENPNKNNDLIIEPRDTFYSSGTIIDWSEKLNRNKDIDIKPMGLLDAKDYLFTYTKDEDYWNDRFYKTTNKIFGQRQISSNNDFLVNQTKTELMFAPTPMVSIPLGTVSNRVVPQLVKVSNNGALEAVTGKLRLLYWGGIKSTNQTWQFQPSSGTTTLDYYPYAGHLDDSINPTVDLNFGVPEQLFYVPDSYTNNNLYNRYWKKFIEEITDKDSKILKAEFYLTAKDILQLDFRNQIFLDNHYYRINKVFDYNPTEDGLTKVELLKIKEAPSFTSSSGTVNASTITIGEEQGGAWFIPQKTNGNTFGQNGQQSVQGYNNYVDPTAIAVIVNGSNNTIGGGANNITLLNSSGVTVYPGVSNVALINSSGVTVTASNQTYINNNLQELSQEDGIKYVQSATYNANLGETFLIVDNIGVNVTINLENLTTLGNEITIKSATSYTVRIQHNSTYDRQLDGANYIELNIVYQSLKVKLFDTSPFISWAVTGKYL